MKKTMTTSKPEQTKEKSKSKTPCNSKQASKFLEKEGFNNYSLNFKGLAVSLNDFTPNQTENLKGMTELDFDIGKQMKKLEKKDAGTKQKALVELIELVNNKDNQNVVGMLRYWPKMYDKLSLDDDKRVRELNQELMSNLARLCGKNLGLYIKQLLPTWILSQSDVHNPVAILATKSFMDTFPDESRRQKAYILCWEDISTMISNSLNKLPSKEKICPTGKERVSRSTNEDKPPHEIDSLIIKESGKCKKKGKLQTFKKEVNEQTIESVIETQPESDNVVSSNLDEYVVDLVLHLRTLITLLPYISNDAAAIADLTKWINSKQFWGHYTVNASTNVIAIYLVLSCELLTHVPHLVIDVQFILSHLTQALRLVNNYHSTIVPLVWRAILQLVNIVGDKVWQHVSFQNTFMPRWLKMLECAIEGRFSLASSFMLPFIAKIPVDFSMVDSTVLFTRIFESMTNGLCCLRIRNSNYEANCLVVTILECATYTILGARSAENHTIKDKILSIIWNILEKYLTDSAYSRANMTVKNFCKVALRPLMNKGVVYYDQVIEVLTSWIDKHHNLLVFSEHLAELIVELCNMQVSIKLVLNTIELKLLQKVVDNQHCLLPYLSVVSSQKITDLNSEHRSQLIFAFSHCNDIIAVHDPAVTTTIAIALANIINNVPECAQNLYEELISSLTIEQTKIFFVDFYAQFLSNADSTIANLLAAVTLKFWETTLSRELSAVLSTENEDLEQEDKVDVCHTLSLVFMQCHDSPLHYGHLSPIIAILDAAITRATHTVVTPSAELIDVMITIAKYTIDEVNSRFTLNLIPHSIVLNLVKMMLFIVTDSSKDLSQLTVYLQHCTADATIFLQILDEVLLDNDTRQVDVGSALISIVIRVGLPLYNQEIVDHLSRMLIRDIIDLDQLIMHQQRYSLSVVHQQQSLLLSLVHKLHFFIQLKFDSHTSLLQFKNNVDHSCVLITPIILASFSNCHHSAHILEQCESIYKYAELFITENISDIFDHVLLSIESSNSSIFDKCFNLGLISMKHFMPINYSQWPHNVLLSVDQAIDNWTDSCLSDRQLSLMLNVLIPSAVKARYLVQEIILATIASYLSDDVNPSLDCINRAISLVKSLTLTDQSYFSACFPLILCVKKRFETHIDQLYDASVIMVDDCVKFDLSSLLEILIVGVESSWSSFSHSHWDFVLCLISSLSRSAQFINSGDFNVDTVSGNTDHILNSVLLLRLIANVSIALASVTNDAVLDEWDNFFSEPIFSTILDMFSLISGDHTHGKLVSSNLFTFYTEALAEVVSLCPVNVLLAHNFSAQIHINDPVEFPKDLLIIFNSLLESLSSYSLSTQLAAYNCLLNLTDHLSALLLQQITKVESDENLDSFSINLPHKLLTYLESDDLIQLTFDKLENEIVLTRSFLAWSVLLQLFSCSQPKVRAEISTFLVTHDRLFDRFLSFCYAFMPKSPLVFKKHVSFLAVHGKQTCNLISDEPQIFSKCLEKRSKFIIYHLSSYVFRRSIQVLPNLARGWFMSLDGNSQQQVDSYVRQYITPELFKIEFKQLKEYIVNNFDEKLEINALPTIGEVTVRYIVPGDQCLEQVISMPNNYPIGKIAIDFKKEMTVKIPHWKSWIIQMTSTMQNQNGSIIDGVTLWKKNLDNHFEGMEECMICYSILHALKYTLPSMKCRQCKKKFHRDCMHKWFQSTTNPTCPNCRNVFFDGTYKRAQYGDTGDI